MNKRAVIVNVISLLYQMTNVMHQSMLSKLYPCQLISSIVSFASLKENIEEKETLTKDNYRLCSKQIFSGSTDL